MTRQKLSLLIGFPIFGILIFYLPELLGSSSMPDILFFLNVIPIIMMWILDFIILDLPEGINIDTDHVIYSIFPPIFIIIFWLPVGFLANFCLEKYKTHRKNQINNLD